MTAVGLMSKRSTGARSGRSKVASAQRSKNKTVPSNLEELFARLRSGAANVAGVDFQVSLSVMLCLLEGRAASSACQWLPCHLKGSRTLTATSLTGRSLLVQSKERGPGARDIAAAELAEILAHAAMAVQLNDAPSGVRGSRSGGDDGSGHDGDDAPAGTWLAVVTNGRFGSSLPETGWTATLDIALTGHPSGAAVRETLLTALKKELQDNDMSAELAPVLLLGLIWSR